MENITEYNKIMDEIYNQVLNLCRLSNYLVLEDQIKEIFASKKCCMKTAKGVLCSKVAKEDGHCGIHLKKKISKKCEFVRVNGVKCSLYCVSASNSTCWLHLGVGVDDDDDDEDTIVRRRAPKRKRAKEVELVEVQECVESKDVVGAEKSPAKPSFNVEYNVVVSHDNVELLNKTNEHSCMIIRDVGKGSTKCGSKLRLNTLHCTRHKKSKLTADVPASMNYKCAALETLETMNFRDRYGPLKTIGLYEGDIDGDVDEVIDEENACPTFKPKFCIYWNEMGESRLDGEMCGEPVYKDGSMCKEHRKYSKMFHHNPKTNRYFDPYWEPSRPFLETARLIAPNFKWFPHLNFFAHITPKGPIVVGKAWSLVFPESLNGFDVKRDVMYSDDGEEVSIDDDKLSGWQCRYGETNDPCVEEKATELIRRCHNNGLLYKVLDQKVLHKQFNLPKNLDTLCGFGFTSFEQMIVERPSLYIKYWNVWLGHVRRAKDFVRFRHYNQDAVKVHLNIYESIDWEYYFKYMGPKIGLYHVEVPAPSLEQVEAADFNPFKYCSDWVKVNEPSRINEPHFPPMYLLYPFPLEYYEDKYYMENRIIVEDICNKRLYSHYNLRGGVRKSIESWVQWLKYGEHRGEFIKLYSHMCIEDVYPKDLENRCNEIETEKSEYANKYKDVLI